MTNKKVSQKPTHERLQTLITPEAGLRLRIAAALSKDSGGQIISRLILQSLPPASQALAETDHLGNA